MIYLDHAATTFPKPECVLKRMDEINRNLAVNIGRSSYPLAREGARIIKEAREETANLFHAIDGEHVIFAPSITIALNQILRGIPWKEGKNVYVTPYEHNAVLRTLHSIQKEYPIRLFQMPLNRETLAIDLKALAYQFMQNPPFCICINHISNVTGYILPIEKITQIAREYHSIFIVDAAQSAGLIPIDVQRLGIDFLAFAGHKNLYGPVGIGGFIHNSKIQLNPVLTGGTGSDSLNLDMPQNMPGRYECASPNLSAIAGYLEGVRWNRIHQKELFEQEKCKGEALRDCLRKIKEVQLYEPPKSEERIGVVSFRIRGYQAADIGQILSEDYDIAIRYGYHCAPYIHEYLKDFEFGGTVRASVGWSTKETDIKRLEEAIRELAK